MAEKGDTTEIKKGNDTVVYTVGSLYVLLSQYLSGYYGKLGLSPATFNILMLVKHLGKDEGIPQSGLSDRLYVSAANITRILDTLEKRGLVRRASSKKDRRVKLIRITPEGSALLDGAWGLHARALNRLFTDFSEEEKDTFAKLLERSLADVKGKLSIET